MEQLVNAFGEAIRNLVSRLQKLEIQPQVITSFALESTNPGTVLAGTQSVGPTLTLTSGTYLVTATAQLSLQATANVQLNLTKDSVAQGVRATVVDDTSANYVTTITGQWYVTVAIDTTATIQAQTIRSGGGIALLGNITISAVGVGL